MENEIALVLTTFPDEKSAKQTCVAMVKLGLAACAQTAPEIGSVYIWKGELCSDREVPVSLKIPLGKVDEAREFFLKNHPYECPQWVVLNAVASFQYAAWVNACPAAR